MSKLNCQQIFDAIHHNRDTLLPVLDALNEEASTKKSNRELTRLITTIRDSKDVISLSQKAIPIEWLTVVAAAISSGSDSKRLGEMLMKHSNPDLIRPDQWRSLAYPFCLLLISIAIFVAACYFILPIFDQQFITWDLDLPWSTSTMLRFSVFLRQHPWLFLGQLTALLATLVVFVWIWIKYALTSRLFGSFISGNASALVAMSQFTASAADLLAIDVSLPDAIWIAGQGCRHHQLKLVSQRLARHVFDSGQPISASGVAHALPANVILALDSTAESWKSGSSIRLLRELSTLYAERATDRVRWFDEIAPHLGVVGIGILLLFLIWTFFSPFLSLMSGLI